MSGRVLASFKIDGRAYVVVPRADYLRVGGDRRGIERVALGRRLHLARKNAGLTQTELAQKIDCKQSAISQAEAGIIGVSEDFVSRFLRACGASRP